MTRVARATRAFGTAFAAAAIGRLVIYLLLRDHWSWQPPYHSAYLLPPDYYDSATREYLVAHMPGYWSFLRLVRTTGFDLYITAPGIQHVLQLLAIARLTTTIDEVVTPARPRALPLALVLGLDPWLCETANVMQPAAITALLFIILVERAIALSREVVRRHSLPAASTVAAVAAGLCAIGTYFRADFATDVVLAPAAIGLTAWLVRAATPLRTIAFAAAASVAALAIVLALLIPRALMLHAKSGAFVLTTNSGGGALWYGLGEISNPWNIPNPEIGDDPIETFGRERGYPHAFASARTSAFFAALFNEHVRERPAILLKLYAARVHRVMLGWAPASISLYKDYEFRPEIKRMGERMQAGASRLQLLATREHGGWILKVFGLRYLGTALLWLMVGAAASFALRRGAADPVLLLPLLAYAVGVAPFVLVHWSARYGQQYYWLGWLSLYLLIASARADRC